MAHQLQFLSEPYDEHTVSLTARFIKENIMGKYFLAWLLGVPVLVLVIVYIFFH